MLRIRAVFPHRLLVDNHLSAHHGVKCIYFLSCIRMFWLPCCQREDHFSSLSFSYHFGFVADIFKCESPWHAPRLFHFFSHTLSFSPLPLRNLGSYRVCPAAPTCCRLGARAVSDNPLTESKGKKSEFDSDCLCCSYG